jgi:membrane-associated two-gene conflict system component 1 (EACC1)
MRVSVLSPHDPELVSLYEWLAGDEAFAEVSMGASGERPDAQSPLDLINVILSNTTAIMSLVVAYASWRRSGIAERPDAAVTFKAGGVEVTVRDADPETIDRLIAALEQAALDHAPEPLE